MTTWVSVLVIGLGTILLLGVSWRSFRHSRSHGVFRFFAAEAVLGLVVLNAPVQTARRAGPAPFLGAPGGLARARRPGFLSAASPRRTREARSGLPPLSHREHERPRHRRSVPLYPTPAVRLGALSGLGGDSQGAVPAGHPAGARRHGLPRPHGQGRGDGEPRAVRRGLPRLHGAHPALHSVHLVRALRLATMLPLVMRLRGRSVTSRRSV